MSADNWQRCPKCLEKFNKQLEELKESYGKIPQEQYDGKLKKMLNEKSELEPRLREDYEIYMEDCILTVKYRAVCQDCRFTYKFETTKNILEDN